MIVAHSNGLKNFSLKEAHSFTGRKKNIFSLSVGYALQKTVTSVTSKQKSRLHQLFEYL